MPDEFSDTGYQSSLVLTDPPAASFHDAAPYQQEAARRFCDRLDDEMRRQRRDRLLPWEKPVAVGQVDWWRVHAYALDRLDELLSRSLPDGQFTDNGTAWRGRHDEAAPWSLLAGTWSEPATGKRGSESASWLPSNARSLKVTAVLPPEALLGLVVPNGEPRFRLAAAAGGGTYTCDLNAKGVRRAIAAVREHGAENVVAIVQGKLVGNAIEEAGLSAQPKAPKAAAPVAA